MLIERMLFEDLLYKLVKCMVILYEQKRLWADWEDKLQIKRWPLLSFIVALPLRPVHFSSGRESGKYPEKVHRGVHASLYDFESEKYYIAVIDLKPANPTGSPKFRAATSRKNSLFPT